MLNKYGWIENIETENKAIIKPTLRQGCFVIWCFNRKNTAKTKKWTLVDLSLLMCLYYIVSSIDRYK